MPFKYCIDFSSKTKSHLWWTIAYFGIMFSVLKKKATVKTIKNVVQVTA